MSRSDSNSQTDDRARGAPSNAELGERTARLEQKIDHISEGVKRIETSLAEEHDDLAEQVAQNERRVNRFWSIYRFFLYMVPLVLGTSGVSYVAFF